MNQMLIEPRVTRMANGMQQHAILFIPFPLQSFSTCDLHRRE